MLIRAEVKGVGHLPDGHNDGALEHSDIKQQVYIGIHKNTNIKIRTHYEKINFKTRESNGFKN